MRRRRHTVHRQGARKLLASGDRAGARRHLLTALRLYPFDPKAVALASLFAAGALRRARGTP